ncbi:MAG: hypothetical protein JMDDDDMK_03769 [Acidobacteria bacterium]|nr:hypothetical protein [Acidobacteriota bacterium]
MITAYVTGSVALTPNSMLLINRVNASAAPNPIATPTSASVIPCFTTNPSTSRVCAPSAIRMPISCVRSATA